MKTSFSLCGVLALVMTAQAAPPPPTVLHNPYMRNLVVGFHNATRVAVWSNPKDPALNSSSVYRFVFDVGSYEPHIRQDYFVHNGDTSAGYTWALGFSALVEYNATIPISQSMSVENFTNSGANWSPVTIATVSGLNGTLTTISSSFIDPTAGSMFNMTVDAYLVANYVQYNSNVTLAQNVIKYTVTINNWNYMYQNSSLAFIKHFRGRVGENRQFNGGNITLSSGAAFTWDSTVNGNNTDSLPVAVNSFLPQDRSIPVLPDPDDSMPESVHVGIFQILHNPGSRYGQLVWDPNLQLQAYSLDAQNGQGVVYASGAVSTVSYVGSIIFALLCSVLAVSLPISI